MKEIIISSGRIKKEILTWCICFVIANLINLYAILAYNGTSMFELITSLGYVVIASLFIYFLWTFLRIIFWGIKSLLKRKK